MGFDPLGDAVFGSNNNPTNMITGGLPGIGGTGGGMFGSMGSMFGGSQGSQTYVPATMTDWSKFFSEPSRYAGSQPNMYSGLFGNNNGQQLITGQSTQYQQPTQPQYQGDPNTQYNTESVANALTSPTNNQVGWRNYEEAPRMNSLTPVTPLNQPPQSNTMVQGNIMSTLGSLFKPQSSINMIG